MHTPEILILYAAHIDGFQMSIKRPTSGGQARDQEAAVQRTFHLVRSSFFYLQTAIVRTQPSAKLLACILPTAALNTDPTLALRK